VNGKFLYKDYVFTYNPEHFEIIDEKETAHFFAPLKGDVVQVLGRKARVVRGRGELFGQNAIDQYFSLWSYYSLEGAGSLTIPGGVSFSANFVKLKMIGESNPTAVKYEFEFVEVML
jgi:hypothetical protein